MMPVTFLQGDRHLSLSEPSRKVIALENIKALRDGAFQHNLSEWLTIVNFGFGGSSNTNLINVSKTLN